MRLLNYYKDKIMINLSIYGHLEFCYMSSAQGSPPSPKDSVKEALKQ